MKMAKRNGAKAGLRGLWAGGVCLVSALRPIFAADFTVTTPGGVYAYTINGVGNNPTLTLVRGRTYTFAVTTSSIHPFQILSPGTAVGNNTSSGTITYTVATNAPATNNLGYRCSVHNFSGIILTVGPPPPPTIRILSLTVKSNLTLVSTGTNTWYIFPEFRTNIASTNWFGLTVQTNRYVNGTNETICGRPAGTNVFIRIRAQ